MSVALCDACRTHTVDADRCRVCGAPLGESRKHKAAAPSRDTSTPAATPVHAAPKRASRAKANGKKKKSR